MGRFEKKKRVTSTQIESTNRTAEDILISRKANINADPQGDIQRVRRSNSMVLREREPSYVNILSQDYYEQMLKNSTNEELVRNIKDIELAEDYRKKILWLNKENKAEQVSVGEKDTGKIVFRQKLPVAKTDSKGRNVEKADIKQAKQTFRNADLCTTRESAAFKEYFKKWRGNNIGAGGPETVGEDVPDDPRLMEYVNKLVSFEFGAFSLTDDYLSEHAVELYEFHRLYSQYDRLQQRYPAFFRQLSYDKKSILDARAKMADSLGDLLQEHLRLHGIEINPQAGENKEAWVRLIREDPNKEIRHRIRREKKSAYDRKLNDFIDESLRQTELELAKSYLAGGETDDDVAALQERISANQKACEACGTEMAAAVEAIRRSLNVKEQLGEKQRGFIAEYYQAVRFDENNKQKQTVKSRKLMQYITRTNRRIRLALQHADRYKEFISFALGDIPQLSPATAQFLQKENQNEMMTMLRFRAAGDYQEECLAINSRIMMREKIAELRAKKDKASNEAADAIEEELRTNPPKLEKMSVNKFYERFTEFKTTAKEKAEIMQKAIDTCSQNTELTREKVKAFAEENHLESIPDRTFGNIRTLSGDIKDYEWMCLACGYEPTPQTPLKVREEIRERGLRPILNMFLSITPEKVREIKAGAKFDPEDPESWKSVTFTTLCWDYKNFMEKLPKYDLELSDEEYVRLNANAKLGQDAHAPYKKYMAETLDPWFVVMKDANALGAQQYPKLMAIANGGISGAEAKEVRELNRRYSMAALGFTGNNPEVDRVKLDIPKFLGVRYYPGLISSAGNPIQGDYETALSKYQDEVRDEIERKDQARLDKVNAWDAKNDRPFEMEKLFMADYQKAAEKVKGRLTPAEWNEFEKRYGTRNTEFKADDLAAIMRPVGRDLNGTVRRKDLAAYHRNSRDIQDYLSGDENRQKAMLVRQGREMASYRFPDEMLNKDHFFDTVNGGFIKCFDHIRRGTAYKALYRQHQAFFESDAFTDEERDAIRKNIADNTVIDEFQYTAESFLKSYVMDVDGGDLAKAENISFGVNKKLGILNHRKRYLKIASEAFDSSMESLPKYQNNISAAYRDMQEPIRKSAELEARLRAKLADEKDTGKREKLNESRARISKCRAYIFEHDKEQLSDQTVNHAVRNGLEEIFPEQERVWARKHAEESAMENNFITVVSGDKNTEAIRDARLQIRDAYGKYDGTLTDEQRAIWDEKMKGESFISFDSFRRLMLPVLRDDSGIPLKGYEEADKQNRRTFQRFISGDPEQIRRALFDIGNRMLEADLEFDRFNADYILKNAEDFYTKALPFIAFKALYDQYPDFFEGQAFNEEQRDKLRILMADGVYVDAMKKLVKFENGMGLEEGRDMKPGAEAVSGDERAAWVNRIRNSNKTLMAEAEKELSQAIGTEGNMREHVIVYPGAVRGLAVLSAGEKADLRKLKAKVREFKETDKTKGMPDSMAVAIRQREERIRLFDEARRFIDHPADRISDESLQVLKNMLSNAKIDITDNELNQASGDPSALSDLILRANPEHNDGWFDALPDADEPVFEEAEAAQDHFVYDEKDPFEEELRKLEEQEREKKPEIDKEADAVEKQAENKKEKKAEVEKPVEKAVEIEKNVINEEKSEKQKKTETAAEMQMKAAAKEKTPSAGAELAPGTYYEKQGYHNCWACSGAALLNKFIYMQDKKLPKPVNQFDVRHFVPAKDEYKTLEEVNEYSNVPLDKSWYATNRLELDRFMGQNKKEFGNIFETADFFMKLRDDLVIGNIDFKVSSNRVKYEKQKSVFVRQVTDVLSTGNLVAIMNSSEHHYRTITRIQGDKVTYYDSNTADGHNPEKEITRPVSEVFAKGDSISITWFSPLREPGDMQKEYPDLKYNEKEGYTYGKKEDLAYGAVNLAQTKGICITRQDEDQKIDIIKSVYIPKKPRVFKKK